MRHARWFLLPLFLYFLSLATGYYVTGPKREAIRTLINDAGARGEPIIVTLGSDDRYWHPAVSLFNLQGDSIRLFGRDRNCSAATPFFDDNGTLLFPGGSDDDRFFTPNYCVSFPDFRIRRFSPPDLSDVGFRNIWLDSTEILSPNKWYLESEPERWIVTDLVNGEVHRFGIFGDHSWENAQYKQYFLASDASAVVIKIHEGSGSSYALWRYHLASNECNFISTMNLGYEQPVVVGPRADVIGVYASTTRFFDIIFIDGRNGNVLASERDAFGPAIGKRWAVCISGFIFQNGPIVVFDMQDNWRRMQLSATADYRPAIYEPPPNGLDGMLDNYTE